MRLVRASEAAIDEIENFCSEHAPEAEFRRGGWLWTATTAAQLGAWDKVVARADALAPGTFHRPDPREVARRSGSPQHLAGVIEPSNATVQPAALARAMRRYALELGVRVFEQSKVTRIDRGTTVTLITAQGSIRAPSVVIATNAWAAALRPLRNKLFVISSDMIATEPIADRLDDIGWTQGEAISDSQTLVCYYRTTAEGRIAFGKGGMDDRLRWTRTSCDASRRHSCLDGRPGLPSLLPHAAHGEDHPRLGRAHRPNPQQPSRSSAGCTGTPTSTTASDGPATESVPASSAARSSPPSRSAATMSGHSADSSPPRPAPSLPSRSALSERTSSGKRSFAKRRPRRSRSGHHGSLSHSQSSRRPVLKTSRTSVSEVDDHGRGGSCRPSCRINRSTRLRAPGCLPGPAWRGCVARRMCGVPDGLDPLHKAASATARSDGCRLLRP